MNEIDAKVLAVAENYYREHGKPPALILVHPEIAKRMTRRCFNFHKPPELDVSAFWKEGESLRVSPLDIIKVDVRILDISHMQLMEYYQSSDRIECLSEAQVMYQITEMGLSLNE